MTSYRLVIEEIKDDQAVTSYTRWVDAVQVRGAEKVNQALPNGDSKWKSVS